MRCAILGDIHANLQALEAVIEDAMFHGCMEFHILGDIVGYNANPVECLEKVSSLPSVLILGNHDAAAAGEGGLESFGSLARIALEWTRSQLSVEHKEWLQSLRSVRQIRGTTLVHATLDSPTSWAYIRTPEAAELSLACQRTPVCFFGHTHVPGMFVQGEKEAALIEEEVSFPPGKKVLINPGSVGQPRDGDWRASYMIHDEKRDGLWLRRVEYDVEGARLAVLAAGLPVKLGERLLNGS